MAIDVVRARLLRLLDGEGAHMSFQEAVADFPADLRNVEPPNVPYTPWAVVEHIRFTQHDILDYLINPDYKEPTWPASYWPPRGETADDARWKATIDGFEADLARFKAMVADPATDLTATVPHAGVSLFEQAALAADHTAYHVGELAILRQVMNAWPAGHA
jgi:hypothetical protein